jgi:hypothetical protein
VRGHFEIAYKGCADGYLGQGAHMLGGTLFLPKGLVYRTVHSQTRYIRHSRTSNVRGALQWAKVAFDDAVEAIRANGLPEIGQSRVQKQAVAPRRGIRRHIKRWRKPLSKRLASA